MLLEKLLPLVQENISLKDLTTFKIGGPARYFFIAKSKDDLIRALGEAKKLRSPFFILGGGSNLLISDEGFRGLVIKIENCELKITGSKLIAGAGTQLALLVAEAAKNNLTGLEWASGIPGTVGGAIRGNAGAFKGSMADTVKSIEALSANDLRFNIYNLKQCGFGYRDSVFKKNKNLIIYSAEFELKTDPSRSESEGKDEGKLRRRQTSSQKVKEYLNYRRARHPKEPSAGSVFKNVEFKFSNLELLLKKFPALEQFREKGRIPAAFLISECGLKGKKIGQAAISEKHPNFIVNLGQGRARDVRKLIKFIKKSVKNKFGIKIEEEIQFLGF
jgi:UDP-N-acetylmuramate dehydrogenase